MSTPTLARKDEAAVSNIRANMPQALLIIAEQGLDSARLIDKLSTEIPSDTELISPKEGKRDIGIEQIRSIISSTRTHILRRRVVIIRFADEMTEESQNALLKIVEEPLKNLYFILEARAEQNILPTLRSRCQILTLHRTSAFQDSTILKKYQLDAQAKQQILFLAAGRPELIRHLAEKPAALNSLRDIAADAKIIMGGAPYAALVTIQKYVADRQKSLRLLDTLLTMARFHIKSSPDSLLIMSPLIERIRVAEESLHANGNIKLSMLQLLA